MLARQGGIMGVVAAVATTSVFFVVSTLSSMQPALIAAVAAAILALGLQLIRRQALRQEMPGLSSSALPPPLRLLLARRRDFS